MPDRNFKLIKSSRESVKNEALGVIAHSKEQSRDRHLQDDKFFTRELVDIAMELFKVHINGSISSEKKDELIKNLVNSAGDVVFDAFKKKTGVDTNDVIIFNNGDICDLGNGNRVNLAKLPNNDYLRITRNRPYFDKGSGAPLKPPVKDLSKIDVTDAFLRYWDVRYVHERLKKFLEKN